MTRESTKYKELRRELRRRSTSAEQVLWQQVRARRFHGYKFYRQFSIVPYIVDFYCPAKRLAIELDGNHHANRNQRIYDEQRTQYLNSLNITVNRFWNSEVLTSLDKVMETILRHLRT